MNTQLITVDSTAMSLISYRITPVQLSGSEDTESRFWEFFTTNVRNPNTRMALNEKRRHNADPSLYIWYRFFGLVTKAICSSVNLVYFMAKPSS